MRLLTFQSSTGPCLGIKTSRGVIDVSAAHDALKVVLDGVAVPKTIEALYSNGETALQALRSLEQFASQEQSARWLLAEESLQLGPCIQRPEKIICIGLNYRGHAAETGGTIPESPILFPKYVNALAGSNAAIPLSPHAHKYDYEAELAVVIGRRARNVEIDDALNYVLGYCNANDLSARDLQFRTSQWTLGKILDKFLPLGPYLVTADEIRDPQNLCIRCWLNGELRQDSNTSDMVFSVAYLVSYLSQYITLEAGDVICTGTPEGVILGKHGADRVWMKAGDEVTIEIEGLGRLTNALC
jgi:2-keto-4-pentenoate hydratase/2-oxohepta-3-ene-1,7-dioic acid hydratase in catechol pathway